MDFHRPSHTVETSNQDRTSGLFDLLLGLLPNGEEIREGDETIFMDPPGLQDVGRS